MAWCHQKPPTMNMLFLYIKQMATTVIATSRALAMTPQQLQSTIARHVSRALPALESSELGKAIYRLAIAEPSRTRLYGPVVEVGAEGAGDIQVMVSLREGTREYRVTVLLAAEAA